MLPTALRRTLPVLLDSIGQTSLAQVLRRSRFHHLSAYGFQAALEKQAQFRTAFLDRMDEQQVDALICPPFASVAMKHLSTDIVLAIS